MTKINDKTALETTKKISKHSQYEIKIDLLPSHTRRYENSESKSPEALITNFMVRKENIKNCFFPIPISSLLGDLSYRWKILLRI